MPYSIFQNKFSLRAYEHNSLLMPKKSLNTKIKTAYTIKYKPFMKIKSLVIVSNLL